MRDFGTIATAYAQDVVGGAMPACKWVRLACERHLRDLKRAEAGWDYTFNPDLVDHAGKSYRPAQRICMFAELMPHIKGDWAARRELIELQDWQIFILASIFGWIKVATSKRRFRVADLYVPRKNAKSTMASVIGNYMLTADGEFGAEVYSGATSEDQAMEVFMPAVLMARAMPDFLQTFGVVVPAARRPTNMSVPETNSKFEPVIGRPGDGASPSCALVDEYHEHKTSELYDTMQTGMGARSQPLLANTTTAGSDIGGPCFQHQQELEKILEGVIENEQRFGIIFTVDEGDDWTSEDALIKANPNFGVSVDADFLRTQQRDAQNDPRKQSTFKTKHLNIWVAAASPWLNIHHLQMGGDPALTLESFRGQECVVGLDLASKQDIAAVAWVFRSSDADGRDHYSVVTRSYLPEEALLKPENARYRGWVDSGHLTVTPGNMISLNQIEEDVAASFNIVLIKEIAKDPYGGQQMGASLQEQGFVVVDIPQIPKYMSDPMKEIAALVDAGRFHHDGNPCSVWQYSNVEIKLDRNDNIFPRKARFANKIDVAVATIVAMNRAMVGADSSTIGADYELMVV